MCSYPALAVVRCWLGRYNRRTNITNNQFSWLGQNAIASWGRTNYNDGTNGDQPRFTTVSVRVA